MTNIPTAFDKTNLTISGNVFPGEQVTNTALAVLSNNHNFIGATYAPPVATVAAYGNPLCSVATGANWHNLCMVPITADATARGIRFQGFVSNNATVGSPAPVVSVRLVVNSTIGTSQSISNSTSDVAVDLTCATPSSGMFVACVQIYANNVSSAPFPVLTSGSWFWQYSTGSALPTSPTAGGYVFSEPVEVSNTYPLTVEYVNRLLGGPRTTYNASPQACSSLVASYSYPIFTREVIFWPMTRMIIKKRRTNMKVKFHAMGFGGQVRIDHQGGSVTLDLPGTEAITDPFSSSNIVSSSTVDFSEFADLSIMTIYLKAVTGTPAQANLHSLIAEEVKT